MPCACPLVSRAGFPDADTGLTRFVWRDDDADTGQFTTLDPMACRAVMRTSMAAASTIP